MPSQCNMHGNCMDEIGSFGSFIGFNYDAIYILAAVKQKVP